MQAARAEAATRATELELPQLRSRHLKDDAYEVILDAITSLKLRPGAMVMEGRLARSLGISKTPVRNALVRLEQAGLVRTVPFRGTFVSGVTLRDVKEIFEVRASLEELAIRRAVAEASAAELHALHAVIDAAAEAFRRGELQQSFELIREFHEGVISLSRNRRLGEIYAGLAHHLTRIRNICGHLPGRVETSVIQHRAILTAMEAGDADAAVAAMRAHLDSLASDDFVAAEAAIGAFGADGGLTNRAVAAR